MILSFFIQTSQPNSILLCEFFELFFYEKLGKGSWLTTYLGANVNWYGDRLLEAIKATVKEYNKTQKNCSGSIDSLDSIKRRRDDDDSMGSTG
ncbi:unnamed protein product [Camellia sinensis]